MSKYQQNKQVSLRHSTNSGSSTKLTNPNLKAFWDDVSRQNGLPVTERTCSHIVNGTPCGFKPYYACSNHHKKCSRNCKKNHPQFFMRIAVDESPVDTSSNQLIEKI